jgi:cytochrome oxidase Cu insertion factor (SCO1/SenC/PrrC family)
MTPSVRAALLAALLAVAPATAAAPEFAALRLEPYEPPKPAPAFALPDIDGGTARLEDYRGKVVLLFFWTTY